MGVIHMWHSQQMIDLVRESRGRAAAERLQGPARSIGLRLWAVWYHQNEIERLLQSSMVRNDVGATLRAITGIRTSIRSEEYKSSLLAAEAHVNAAALALHTLADTMSTVIWEALNLDVTMKGHIKPSWRHLAIVVNQMKIEGIAPAVTKPADSLLAADEWCKLHEFIICSRHREMIAIRPGMNLSGKSWKRGLQIVAFDRWQSESASDFLARIHRLVEDRILEIGSALNEFLGLRPVEAICSYAPVDGLSKAVR